ncbi:MAG TPA: periplasmic heavy metal sensor, partial [Polyangia bacterium]|nr:periplasmic heavy metal sensor [Polyangia bacterium]
MSTETISNTNHDHDVPSPRKARFGGARRFWAIAVVAVAVGGLSLSVARAHEFGGFGRGRFMEKALTAAGASDAQKTQIHTIWEGLRPQLKPLHLQAADLRRQMGAAIAAPTVDVARVEQLRKQSMETMDKISAVMTQGMVAS